MARFILVKKIYFMKYMINMNSYVQKLKKEILKSKTGRIKNRYTISLDKKGNILVYDDELRGGKHRLGRLLNKQKTLKFLLGVSNGN